MEAYRSHKSLKEARQAILAMEKREIDKYNSVFKDVEGYGESDMLCVDAAMTKVYLLWSARRAHTFHEEIEALNTGRDAYEKLYHSRYSI